MAFVGRLDLTVPDLLQILSLGKKTGKLRLSRLGNSGEILFKDGKIIYAASDSTRNTLGNILISQKQITETALMAALEMQHLSPKSKRLGAILLEKEIITPAVLQEAIRYQIEQVISEFLTWEGGFFRFETTEIVIDDGITVDANEFLEKAGIAPEHLLLEGTIRLDEKRKTKHPPQVTLGARPSPTLGLSPARQSDEDREAERLPRRKPDATPAPSAGQQAPSRLDTRREPVQAPRARAETPSPPTPGPAAVSRSDARREAERPARTTVAGTPASPADRQAPSRLDTRPQAVRPPHAAPGPPPPRSHDIPGATRADERREAEKHQGVRPGVSASPAKEPSIATHLDKRHKAEPPPRPAPTTTPPRATDPKAVSRSDAPPEAERPEPATAAVTPLPPATTDLPVSEISKPLVATDHDREPIPAGPPSSPPTAEAPPQEIDFPSITDEIMLSSPISPWVLIMHFAADVVGRGVLLSMEKDGITGHDQFGVSDGAESGDQVVRHIKIPLGEPSIFTSIASRRTMYRGKMDPGKWNDYFLERLGGTKPHDVVLIPIIITGKVVAIFYGDDAGTDKPLGDVKPLEAFVGQTFSAIETSLLEKKSKASA